MSGFYVNGIDLDDIFMKKDMSYPGTDTASSASQTHFKGMDGKDLNQRYVEKTNTYPNNGTAAATYLYVNGSDLNTKFAAKYEWDNYTVEAAGSKGIIASNSINNRFGNNPNVNSQYGAIITCYMDLIKTYEGSPVNYEIKSCQGGDGGAGTRPGGKGGNTVALIDPNNNACIIVAGAGGGSGAGNGGPGGAAYNDTLNMTGNNIPIFRYLIGDPLLAGYMYPGGQTYGNKYTGTYPNGGDYINHTLKYIFPPTGPDYLLPTDGHYYGLNAKECFGQGGGGGTDQGGTGGGGTSGNGTQWNGGKGEDADYKDRSSGGGGGGAGYYGGGGGDNHNTKERNTGSPGGGGGSSYINPDYNPSSIKIVANTGDTYIKIKGGALKYSLIYRVNQSFNLQFGE